MARRSLGYVHLQWTCPNCQTRNPGPQKTCSSCGMPQPEDIEFEQSAQEKIIKDEAEIARAQAGPDIHCYYCGSRNSADAERCSQCGAQLSEGTTRDSGQVLGAHRDKSAEPITCPNCGTTNQADTPKCAQCGSSLVEPQAEPEPKPAALKAQTGPAPRGRFSFLGGSIGIIILLLIFGTCTTYFVLSNRTEDTTGQVQSVAWTRNVIIEGLVPVTHEAWRDEIPPEAIIGACTQKIHHTETKPTGRTREICGTPYTVDTGSGFGEVVQDCTVEEITEEVQILADSCEYTVEEWRQVDRAVLQGKDLNPRWPNPLLGSDRRLGEREEGYSITFKTEQGTYTYRTSNPNLFNQAQIGSRWVLRINTFDAVTEIEPAR